MSDPRPAADPDFALPPGHTLREVAHRFGGPAGGEGAWIVEQRDAAGNLVARFESWALPPGHPLRRRHAGLADRAPARTYEQYDGNGELVARYEGWRPAERRR
ncbi:hypothetical protein [Roseomonas sp. BN140053]|uniref:hypothetical protein n=1 Tax=Roseomonas sp. BN140053 TaxID=3391898 RepID=UPI0039ECE2BD